MAREIEYKEINNVRYICEMMPATLSTKTLIELTDVLGRPLLVSLSKGVSTDGGLDELEIDDLAEVSTRLLFEKLTPDNTDRIVKSVLCGVKAEGVGDMSDSKIFDSHFRGEIMHMFRVFAWALEVNYRDFFAAARSSALLSKLKKAGKRAVIQKIATQESGTSSSTETPST